MNSVIIDIQAIVDETSITDKCFTLLFNINNNAKDIAIKNTYIIPTKPKGHPILIANFILMIKYGKSAEKLTITWNKLDIDNTKINELQFLFVTKDANLHIVSNSITVS